MSAEANKALVRRFVEEVQTDGNIGAVDEFLADNFVNHSVRPGLPPDRAGLKQLFTLFRQAFPDARAVIHQQIAECDDVMTRKSLHGTHEGAFLGIPATGREVTIDVIDILRVADGKITDHWSVVDRLGFMQQLGAIAT